MKLDFNFLYYIVRKNNHLPFELAQLRAQPSLWSWPWRKCASPRHVWCLTSMVWYLFGGTRFGLLKSTVEALIVEKMIFEVASPPSPATWPPTTIHGGERRCAFEYSVRGHQSRGSSAVPWTTPAATGITKRGRARMVTPPPDDRTLLSGFSFLCFNFILFFTKKCYIASVIALDMASSSNS